MKTLNVKYPTVTKSELIAGKTFVVEAIRDLDEAIDILCQSLTPEEQRDPFAEDLCPYFGILWPAAIGLARFLGENPELVKGKKVLELGCGLGLPSLVASHLGAQVLATDFHPDVEEYFKRNLRHSSLSCDYERLNWREERESNELFDVVLGSDVLYESRHPEEVARGLMKFCKKGGTIILSDPGRNYLSPFVNAMRSLGIKEELSSNRVDEKDIWILIFRMN